MKRKQYPIFISYRHSDTADKAEHLLSLLEAAGYKNQVSFDRENLDGRFDFGDTQTTGHLHRSNFCRSKRLSVCR